MTTRDEVLREFPHRDVARHGLRIHRLADEIVRLREQLEAVTQERDEDQGVIAVWRGRTERTENQLEAARFMSAGWRRKANQLEDVNAEWAAEMSRVLIDAVNTEALVKVALPDIKFAAWLLRHASTQKVNEHRSMADSASIITQHIERIEESFKKQEGQ